jgi:CpXC protein
MSIFNTANFPCPACGEAVAFDVCASVNADRRPDLREQILKRDFQRGTCGKCGLSFRVEPRMTYFHLGGKQWILVEPADRLPRWIVLEREALATFSLAYGDEASPMAQSLGRGIQVRIAFGWPALREKLLCVDHGLDDVVLEQLKATVVLGMPTSPLADDVELRLTDVRDGELELTWLKPSDERPLEALTIPRTLYDEIAADEVGYQEMRKDLTAGPFVDFNRLLVEADAGDETT